MQVVHKKLNLCDFLKVLFNSEINNSIIFGTKTAYNPQELLPAGSQRDQASESSSRGAGLCPKSLVHPFGMLGCVQDHPFPISVSPFCLFGWPDIKGRALVL